MRIFFVVNRWLKLALLCNSKNFLRLDKFSQLIENFKNLLTDIVVTIYILAVTIHYSISLYCDMIAI